MASQAIALHANILVRAVLGSRVWQLLKDHVREAFLAPDIAFDEVREHLPAALA